MSVSSVLLHLYPVLASLLLLLFPILIDLCWTGDKTSPPFSNIIESHRFCILPLLFPTLFLRYHYIFYFHNIFPLPSLSVRLHDIPQSHRLFGIPNFLPFFSLSYPPFPLGPAKQAAQVRLLAPPFPSPVLHAPPHNHTRPANIFHLISATAAPSHLRHHLCLPSRSCCCRFTYPLFPPTFLVMVVGTEKGTLICSTFILAVLYSRKSQSNFSIMVGSSHWKILCFRPKCHT